MSHKPRIEYSAEVDILYVRLSDTPIEHSDDSEPGVIVDLSESGEVVGLEILDASKRFVAEYKHQTGELTHHCHPGEILLEDFMKPTGTTGYRLAKEIGVSESAISELVRGLRPVTAVTALKLAAYFGTSAEFWFGLQQNFDLADTKLQISDDLAKIKTNPSVLEALEEARERRAIE